MKVEPIGTKLSNIISANYTQYFPERKAGHTQRAIQSREGGIGLAMGGIDRAEEILDGVGRILSDMSAILAQMGSGSENIISLQLAEYFNILRRLIDQALSSSGDSVADGLMTGKTVEVAAGPGNPRIVITGGKTDISLKGLGISELNAGEPGARVAEMGEKIQVAQDRIQHFKMQLTSERTRLAGMKPHSGESTGIDV